MVKDELKKLCLESYLKGQEDLIEMLIKATKEYKQATGENNLSIDEILNVYNDWFDRVKSMNK